MHRQHDKSMGSPLLLLNIGNIAVRAKFIDDTIWSEKTWMD